MSDEKKPSRMDEFLRIVGAVALLYGGMYALSQCGGPAAQGCSYSDGLTGAEC
ncbi:hypothetical protein [Cellulomonas sp. KH9]|uniref:hypothetical protein n=1 Tax=Cellulomonas sp. KH9 TaxID=1855324 RepID=UPI0008E69D4A|nr:hypothetical protein [Cellulomonas sp. KH9]SFK31210.1 hypothetical protein SAMN05216467_2829 [Cellulomonas sp. KH9]